MRTPLAFSTKMSAVLTPSLPERVREFLGKARQGIN